MMKINNYVAFYKTIAFANSCSQTDIFFNANFLKLFMYGESKTFMVTTEIAADWFERYTFSEENGAISIDLRKILGLVKPCAQISSVEISLEEDEDRLRFNLLKTTRLESFDFCLLSGTPEESKLIAENFDYTLEMTPSEIDSLLTSFLQSSIILFRCEKKLLTLQNESKTTTVAKELLVSPTQDTVFEKKFRLKHLYECNKHLKAIATKAVLSFGEDNLLSNKFTFFFIWFLYCIVFLFIRCQIQTDYVGRRSSREAIWRG